MSINTLFKKWHKVTFIPNNLQTWFIVHPAVSLESAVTSLLALTVAYRNPSFPTITQILRVEKGLDSVLCPFTNSPFTLAWDFPSCFVFCLISFCKINPHFSDNEPEHKKSWSWSWMVLSSVITVPFVWFYDYLMGTLKFLGDHWYTQDVMFY